MSDHPTPTRDSLSGVSAEDRSASHQPSAPRDEAGSPVQTVCHRQTPRQATSAVAHVAPEPEEDDPLLAFAPYVHKQPRRNSITPQLQRKFVATLAATGIVVQAARSIGKSMEALYKLRKMPGAEGFAAAWDEAVEYGLWRLEDCAIERAIAEGMSNPRANSLLCFVLSYRTRTREDVRLIVPGHPVYERIRDEVLAEERAKYPPPGPGTQG